MQFYPDETENNRWSNYQRYPFQVTVSRQDL